MKKYFFLLLLFVYKEFVVHATDPRLAALAFSTGNLAPAFAPEIIDYTIQVPLFDADKAKTKTITVTPTASEATATIKVNGYDVLSGKASPNILIERVESIKVEVKAANGSTKTYTIKVAIAGYAGLDKMYSPDHPAHIGIDVKPTLSKLCYEWTAGYWEMDKNGNRKFKVKPELDPSLDAEPSKDFPVDTKNPNDPNKDKRKKNDQKIDVRPVQITTYRLKINSMLESHVTVYPLDIDFFRFDDNRAWKVVVGEPIQYSAHAMPGAINWQWKLGDGTKWTLENNTKQMDKDMLIPKTDLIKASNEWFGDAFGTVTVTCTEPDGKTTHTVTSTKDDPDRKAKVFFDPNLNEDGEEALSADKPPCWFKFWKDGGVIEDMSDVSYSPEFDRELGNFIAGKGITIFQNAFTGYMRSAQLKVGEKTYEYGGSGAYIDQVASVLSHEYYHKYVYDTWTVKITPDQDRDKDRIPNDEEENHSGLAIFPRTNPDLFDTYDIFKNEEQFPKGKYEKREMDEELRCRIWEMQHPKTIDRKKDWAMHYKNPQWNPEADKY